MKHPGVSAKDNPSVFLIEDWPPAGTELVGTVR